MSCEESADRSENRTTPPPEVTAATEQDLGSLLWANTEFEATPKKKKKKKRKRKIEEMIEGLYERMSLALFLDG